MFKYIFTGYLTSAQRLTLHSGLDLNDLYEGENLVGHSRRCEWFTVQRGGNTSEFNELYGTFDSGV